MDPHLRAPRRIPARAAVLLLLVLPLLHAAPGALAQDASATGPPAASSPSASELLVGIEVAGWLERGNWVQGVGLAVGGAMGALATAFFLVGGTVPGTAGAKKLATDEGRLEAYYKKLDKLLGEEHCTKEHAEMVTAIENAADHLRDDIREERRSQYRTAAILFFILGTMFAVVFAKDFLQALFMGAGWSGFAVAIGLRKEKDEKEAAATQSTKEAESADLPGTDPDKPLHVILTPADARHEQDVFTEAAGKAAAAAAQAAAKLKQEPNEATAKTK